MKVFVVTISSIRCHTVSFCALSIMGFVVGCAWPVRYENDFYAGATVTGTNVIVLGKHLESVARSVFDDTLQSEVKVLRAGAMWFSLDPHNPQPKLKATVKLQVVRDQHLFEFEAVPGRPRGIWNGVKYGEETRWRHYVPINLEDGRELATPTVIDAWGSQSLTNSNVRILTRSKQYLFVGHNINDVRCYDLLNEAASRRACLRPVFQRPRCVREQFIS